MVSSRAAQLKRFQKPHSVSKKQVDILKEAYPTPSCLKPNACYRILLTAGQDSSQIIGGIIRVLSQSPAHSKASWPTSLLLGTTSLYGQFHRLAVTICNGGKNNQTNLSLCEMFVRILLCVCNQRVHQTTTVWIRVYDCIVHICENCIDYSIDLRLHTKPPCNVECRRLVLRWWLTIAWSLCW